MRRSKRPRSRPVSRRRSPRSSNASARRASLKRSARKPGGPTTRPAATSTGRRTSCSMRSAGDSSSASSTRRCSRCGGGSGERDGRPRRDVATNDASRTQHRPLCCGSRSAERWRSGSASRAGRPALRPGLLGRLLWQYVLDAFLGAAREARRTCADGAQSVRSWW